MPSLCCQPTKPVHRGPGQVQSHLRKVQTRAFAPQCLLMTDGPRQIGPVPHMQSRPNTDHAPIRTISCSTEISTINSSLFGTLVLGDWKKPDHLHSPRNSSNNQDNCRLIKRPARQGWRKREEEEEGAQGRCKRKLDVKFISRSEEYGATRRVVFKQK